MSSEKCRPCVHSKQDDEEDTYFNQYPSSFDRTVLENFRYKCISSNAKLLFLKEEKFQELTVKKWNRQADECTLSVYLDLIGIDEADSKECGAITLDLLLRAGVFVEDEDGLWQLVDDYNQRRTYLFGDAKTIEDMTKFVRDMQDRRISYSAANVQSEILLKALSVVMDFPGGWHTGLNMAQSIYNYSPRQRLTTCLG